MTHRKAFVLAISVLFITLLACDSNDILSAFVTPTITPTFEMAKFTTPTVTGMPTDTPTPGPTDTATPTPEDTATAESSPTSTPSPAEDDESGEAESTSDSPLDTPTPAASPTPTEPPPPPPATPTETPVPTPAPLSGRIAFSVDDGGGTYDVWVVVLPDGEPFTVQQGARQPSFSNDGRLLVNLENSPYEDHIGLLDANYAWQGLVSDSPDDAFPYWQPDGSRYVFSNAKRLLDPASQQPLPHVFMPCSLRPPWEEDREKCRDIATGGKVAVGEFPVWTDDDRVAFFSFEGNDGIYVVSGASALWEAGGVGPKQLLVEGNGRPNDTQGFQVFFSAGSIDQNWEAYVIDLDGSNLVNLSNSPTSQDGLPAVSPDGNWVAFVSDRDGKWGIWAVPRLGVEPIKLVDISKINTNPSPWGTGDRDWTLERLSWGP